MGCAMFTNLERPIRRVGFPSENLLRVPFRQLRQRILAGSPFCHREPALGAKTLRSARMHLATMVAAILAIAASGAFAQERPVPTTPQPPTTDGLAGIPPSPTGQRQPKITDLPPDLAARESDQAKSVEQPNPS